MNSPLLQFFREQLINWRVYQILITYLLFAKMNRLFINYDLYSCSLLFASVQLIDKLYEGVLLTL
jgi:hypothetical protein